jgi:hypothetical protein
MTKRFAPGHDGEILRKESHQTRVINQFRTDKETRVRPINRIIHALNLQARYDVVCEGKVRPDFWGKS